MLPRSNLWGRIFSTPQLLFKKVAANNPDLESPYAQTPDNNVPNDMSGTLLSRFLSIFAIQGAVVDEQVYKVEYEAHPATAVDMLTEWEEFYQLPVKTGFTVAERQERLKYYTDTWRTPRSLEFLLDYAAKLGGEVTIETVNQTEWLGIFGLGAFGASRFGRKIGFEAVNITVISLTDVSPDYFVSEMNKQMYEGVMVNWLVDVGGNLVMPYDETDPNLIMRYNIGDGNIYIPMG